MRFSIASENDFSNRPSPCCSFLLSIVDMRHSRAVAQLWALRRLEILLNMVWWLQLAIVDPVALVVVTSKPSACSVQPWRSMWQASAVTKVSHLLRALEGQVGGVKELDMEQTHVQVALGNRDEPDGCLGGSADHHLPLMRYALGILYLI